MKRSRQYLALLIGGIGTAAALLGAPLAAADENSGGASNPPGAGCESGGGGGDDGGITDCITPDNAQIRAVPNLLGVQGAEADGEFGGF